MRDIPHKSACSAVMACAELGSILENRGVFRVSLGDLVQQNMLSEYIGAGEMARKKNRY